MLSDLKKISYLLCLISVLSCQQAEHRGATGGTKTEVIPPKSNTQGTVDGGGGNSVTNPKTGERTLLDLAENIDKTPYEFSVRRIVGYPDNTSDGSTLVINLDTDTKRKSSEQFRSYQNILDQNFMKKLLGDDEEFFIWAFGESLQTNEDVSSEDYSKSIYTIHLNAYDLKNERVVKNIRYALTDNELADVGDTGVMKITNPETKKQLAVQDSNGFVLINRSEFEKLDTDSKIGLKIHESLLYLMLKFNPTLIKQKGTAPIRQFVQDLFNYAYLSKVNKTTLISPEKVRESYRQLNFIKIKPNYEIIGKISDKSNESSMICKIEQSTFINPNTGKKETSANYVVTKNGKEITNAYSMDIDFFMKIQMYLTMNGLCIFKTENCRMDIIKQPWENTFGYRYFIGEMPLMDKSNDVIYLQSELLKKYQTARLCK